MAGGPIHPSSAVPKTATRTYVIVYGDNEEMLGYEASVGADSTWRLRFDMPPSLPTGTAKVRFLFRASATSGDAKIHPKWASVAAEEDPDSATLNNETVQTVTWASGDTDVYKELKVTLDADTVVAGEVIAMDVVGETSGWTLAAELGMRAMVIWE